MVATTLAPATSLEPFLPRIVLEWDGAAGRDQHRRLDGSLVSVDVSGFTRLSERLAQRRRAGAEELVDLIEHCFEGLILSAQARDGDVLKFRGDALLIFFSGAGHERRAAAAALDMQAFLETSGPLESSLGPVRLRMSTGVYSGPCDFFLVAGAHHVLLVAGRAASETVRLESLAKAGQVLVNTGCAAALDPRAVGPEREGARLLRRAPTPETDWLRRTAPTPVARDLGMFLPPRVRAELDGHVDGEHRQATVAFLRFSDIDHLTPDDLLASLGDLVRRVDDAAAAYGLTWLESDVDVDGGKIYLAAGVPLSEGDEEERMLRALRDVVSGGGPLTLRAGVNRGRVFAGAIGGGSRRSYTVMGDTVNVAARLAGHAGEGEIVATADVVDRARTRFHVVARPYILKGKARPVEAYVLGAPTAVTTEPPAQRAVSRFVGRNEEVGVLAAALERARARTAQLVEVVGEAGIGKSRLVDEVRAQAHEWFQLATRCEPYTAQVPYAAWKPLLRALVGIDPAAGAEAAGDELRAWVEELAPEFAEWLPLLAIPFDATVEATPETERLAPEFRRERLHEAVARFLERVLLVPTLLVVDDAHWLDDASSELFRHLTAQPPARPWAVCMVRRPGGGFVRAGTPCTRLELAPLPTDDAVALAREAAGSLALDERALHEIVAHAQANPLFVLEVVAAVRGGADPTILPDSVEALVTARLDTLPSRDRTLLRYAAVVGAATDLDVLGELVPDVDVEERVRQLDDFVAYDPTSRTLRFRQELFRGVAYEGLAVRRRREIHGIVAELLERRAGGDVAEVAALLSLHFLRAERFDKAWAYAVTAGRRAQQQYANVVAAELYVRALEAWERLPESDVAEAAEVAEALGDVSQLAARYEDATGAFRRARALAASEPLSQTRLMRKEGIVCERHGRYTDALRRYGRALSILDQLPGGPEVDGSRVEIELAYAGVRFRQGRYRDSIRWSRRAAATAERVDDARALAYALFLVGIAKTFLGRSGRAELRAALPVVERAGDLVLHANVLNNLGIAAYYEGDWSEALDFYRQSAGVSRNAGDIVNVARSSNNEAEILLDRGDLDAARALFADALRIWRAAGYRLGAALATANLGRVAARAGRFDDAHRLLDDALALFEEIGAEQYAVETAARRAECLLLAGRHREAFRDATAVLERSRRSSCELPVALLERIRGYALLQAGKPPRAREHLEASLQNARSVGATYEIALTLLALSHAGEEALADEARALQARLGVFAPPVPPLPR